MTSKLDRIQENASRYIVRNCPAILRMTKVCDAYETTRDLPQFCKDCTDCVIKQVIEKLKNPNNCKYSGKPLVFTDELLQLFDIEEARE